MKHWFFFGNWRPGNVSEECMETEDTIVIDDEATVGDKRPNNDNRVSVQVHDTVGALFLGIVAVGLLIALLRSEARARELLTRLAQQAES